MMSHAKTPSDPWIPFSEHADDEVDDALVCVLVGVALVMDVVGSLDVDFVVVVVDFDVVVGLDVGLVVGGFVVGG